MTEAGTDEPGTTLAIGMAFDHALTPTALLGIGGEFVRVNPALCRFLRRSPEELAGRPLTNFVHADDVAACERFLRLAAQGRAQSSRSEKRFLLPAAAEVWGEADTVVLSGDTSGSGDSGGEGDSRKPGGGRCLLLQIHDVDARKRREAGSPTEAELFQALTTSQRLVATTAHELRTPLTTISGMAETLERRWTDLEEASRLQLLASLRRQTDRLIGLVGDLLVLATADGGAVGLEPETVSVAGIIAQAVAAAGLGSAETKTRCPADLEVTADPGRLIQILVNLLGNAQKHGGGTVAIEATGDDEGITMVVADDGPGVDERFVDHLWERFSRAAGAGTRDPRGSGLGLAIVQELARAHGGRAWYEPNRPRGSRFAVWLPRVPVDIDLRAAGTESLGDGSPTGPRVQLEAVTAALREAPITVFSADQAGTLVVCEGRDLKPLGLIAGQSGRSALELNVVGGLVADALAGAESRQVVEIGERAYEITVRPGPGPDPGGVSVGDGAHGLVIDVTDWHWTGRTLAHAAAHDHLTGLPNRALLVDRLEMALSRLSRAGGAVAVLFVDLDNFKRVNDKLGHEAGDRLLVAAARRLEAVVRPGDTVARYSGDEFVVVCETSGGGDHEASVVAERIVSAFRLPFAVDGREVRAGASIGLTVTSDPHADVAGLLRQADSRMYAAKQLGRGRWEA